MTDRRGRRDGASKPSKKPLNLLHVTARKEWRQWLQKHYRTEPEIWLVNYRKASGKPRISYNDAVEEALCFGWIDSTLKGIDEERFAQRFSPRRPGRAYSQINKERLRKLLAEGKIKREVLAKLPDLSTERFEIAADIREAIKDNSRAWRNFQRFSDTYRRIRVGFIEAARNRPAEFQKRLGHFIRMTEKNKRFGFGGIEGYFDESDQA
jgi:uncharacterized protein YdeI (YjbR/CyaY-like superfamily)